MAADPAPDPDPDEDSLAAARAMWRYRGQRRPPFAIEPGPGQESVWDYPRPPRVQIDAREVRVLHGGIEVARSTRALRVCETASPPTFYLPPLDVHVEWLRAAAGATMCEWKGRATYWALALDGAPSLPVAWSYEDPLPGFETLRSHVAFYPARMACIVDGTVVQPQPGGFYGGWITAELVGPFKGEPGSAGW